MASQTSGDAQVPQSSWPPQPSGIEPQPMLADAQVRGTQVTHLSVAGSHVCPFAQSAPHEIAEPQASVTYPHSASPEPQYVTASTHCVVLTSQTSLEVHCPHGRAGPGPASASQSHCSDLPQPSSTTPQREPHGCGSQNETELAQSQPAISTRHSVDTTKRAKGMSSFSV